MYKHCGGVGRASRCWLLRVGAAVALTVGSGCGQLGFELQDQGAQLTVSTADGDTPVATDSAMPNDEGTGGQPTTAPNTGEDAGLPDDVSMQASAAGSTATAGALGTAGVLASEDGALCDVATYVADDTCGVGYCLNTNQPSVCSDGSELACVPGTPLSSVDDTCDDTDDNCNGEVDEDVASLASTCGLGVCQRSGTVFCQSGAMVDDCAPGTPLSGTDATCDNIDDNCDGQADEDFPITATNCGVGVCARGGYNLCSNGSVTDTCAPGSPLSSNDATCDNIDDDCNGQADEDYVVTSTSCGVGVCARSGSNVCTNGSVSNTCSAGSPISGNDTTCDGIDDDCSGQADEDYVSTATSCGLGVCARSGSLLCSGGTVSDSCVPGTPNTSTDDTINGVDDDCDGSIDEDVPCDQTPRTFAAGSHSNLSVPFNCTRVEITLWGAGGAGGEPDTGFLSASGGAGGPGGYARSTLNVTGAVDVLVGGGGNGCATNRGTNAGSSNYNGGAGGVNTDGSTASGSGSGGSGGSGGRSGGDGSYGGGGGGAGLIPLGILSSPGRGGAGGAGSFARINGSEVLRAGGGGGGGGAGRLIATASQSGYAGGSGCSRDGNGGITNGGGGGGGGVCQGDSTLAGSGRTPANSGQLPSGRAAGGTSSCGGGGDGYAVVRFLP